MRLQKERGTLPKVVCVYRLRFNFWIEPPDTRRLGGMFIDPYLSIDALETSWEQLCVFLSFAYSKSRSQPQAPQLIS